MIALAYSVALAALVSEVLLALRSGQRGAPEAAVERWVRDTNAVLDAAQEDRRRRSSPARAILEANRRDT